MAGIGGTAGRAGWVTALALSWGCMVLTAWASPPISRAAGGAAPAHPLHLDLRPPSVRDLGTFPGEAMDRPSWDRPRTPGGRDSTLPALGAGAGETRMMSRAEAFARRIHREGLPLARLWENHSALVSLGLNAKGKPGLWLVQKTR